MGWFSKDPNDDWRNREAAAKASQEAEQKYSRADLLDQLNGPGSDAARWARRSGDAAAERAAERATWAFQNEERNRGRGR